MTNNINQAMYEVSIILDNTDKSLVQLIPENILMYIRKKAKKEKEFIYDKNKKLKDQQITDTTRGIITLIYRDYFCTEEQRKKYIEYYAKAKEKLELEKKKKYNVDDLFQKNKQEKIEENTKIELYKKETIWTRLKSKLQKIFG